jgi:Na+/H+-dicarboxylate symporter
MFKSNISEWLSLAAVLLGILLGFVLPDTAQHLAFLGKIFLALLKVLILPLIVLSIFLAIAKVSSLNDLKEMGLKTIVYYLVTSALAVVTGLTLANLFIFNTDAAVSNVEGINAGFNFVDRIFSTNIFSSLANGEVLHVVVFTILFSLSFVVMPAERKEPVLILADTLHDVIMQLIGWILKLAPLGILSLVWSTVAGLDAQIFSGLKSFFIATGLAAFIHAFITLPLIGQFVGKFNPFAYFWRVKQALLVSFVTASSSATLPVSTKVVEEDGVSKRVLGFVLPVGATLNMDGSALYQAILAMLFVSLAGVDISFAQQALLFTLIILSSAGTAGVPSGGIVMMTMVINLMGIPNPEYYLGLYVMVDRFWDYPITTINVWGDLIGAKVIDRLVSR